MILPDIIEGLEGYGLTITDDDLITEGLQELGLGSGEAIVKADVLRWVKMQATYGNGEPSGADMVEFISERLGITDADWESAIEPGTRFAAGSS